MIPWWRHQMETFSALLGLCAGNSSVTSEFPSPRPVTRGLMFSLICVQINGWVNNCKAGDLRRHRAHHDVAVMFYHSNDCAAVDYINALTTLQLLYWPQNWLLCRHWSCHSDSLQRLHTVMIHLSTWHLLFWWEIHDDTMIWKRFPRYWPALLVKSQVICGFPL